MGFASYKGEKIISRQKIKARNFIYLYLYGENKKLLLVRVFQKKGFFFPKYYGEYDFFYEGQRLSRQTSVVQDLGTTEEIAYQYDPQGRLYKKRYYNGALALRYTATLSYKSNSRIPSSLKVVRMQDFPFFESQDSTAIEKYLEITGKDFDGTFHLLDFIDSLEDRTQ